MKNEFWIWVAIFVLAVSMVFLIMGNVRSVDDSVVLSDLDNSGISLCSDSTVSRQLLCVSSNTVLPITQLSNANELQRYIDDCPDKAIKILDSYNCVGKQFTIEGNNGSYTVN